MAIKHDINFAIFIGDIFVTKYYVRYITYTFFNYFWAHKQRVRHVNIKITSRDSSMAGSWLSRVSALLSKYGLNDCCIVVSFTNKVLFDAMRPGWPRYNIPNKRPNLLHIIFTATESCFKVPLFSTSHLRSNGVP